MSNSNMDYLYPEFWAASFDELDKGEYNLQNQVSRDNEKLIANSGDTVNVPLAGTPSEAGDWTPGDAITAGSIAQTRVQVVLNKSKSSVRNLNGTELSLSPYRLIEEYGIVMAQEILMAVNNEIYKEALGSTQFIDAISSLDEDNIVDARTSLSNNKISRNGRIAVCSPDDMDTLLKLDAFQHVNVGGTDEVMKEGKVQRKFGFDFYENNIIEKYTPVDVTGAVNNKSTAYAAGATTVAVDGFNDDANPIRVGDIVTFADEVGTPKHTITATTTSSSDTVSITFYPALAGADPADDDDVVTITPSRSILCMVPSGIALACRSYAALPEGTGVKSSVFDLQGVPCRISVWHDAKLGLNIQYDILFGTKLVSSSRVCRILTA